MKTISIKVPLLSFLVIFSIGTYSELRATQRGKIQQGQVSGIKPKASIGGFSDWVVSIAVSSDGRYAAAGTEDVVSLIDIKTNKIVHRFDEIEGFAYGLAFSPDSSLLAVGCYQTVQLLDVKTRKTVRKLEGHHGYVKDVFFSPDGKRIASCGDDESVRIWEVSTGKQQLKISTPRIPVNGVAFSPDGNWIAAALGNIDSSVRPGPVKMWNAKSGKERLWKTKDANGAIIEQGLVEHEKVATEVNFSRDGKYLISTSYDGKVNVYDVKSGKALGYFAGHERVTNAAIFTTDAKIVLSAGGGRAKKKTDVKIWWREDGEEIATLSGHKARVTDLALTPDGLTLYTCSYDKTVAVWDVKSLIEKARAKRKQEEKNNVQNKRGVKNDRFENRQLEPCSNTDLALVSATSIPEKGKKTIRIGMIGLDTSHAIHFTKLLNDPKAKPDVSGCKVVAAYPKGSPDIESSVSRVPGYTKTMKEMGVEIVESIPELLEKVDAVLLETNDGRPHLKQALLVFKAGKPVFIDKPFAGSLVDCIAIFQAAKKYHAPVFSSSSLRYTPGAQRIRGGDKGTVKSAETFSPCHLEKTHPDLYWYGIHGVETLFTVMGTGCEKVKRSISNTDMDEVMGTWSEEREGIFRGYRKGKKGYGGSVVTEKGTSDIGKYAGYRPLMVEIVKFFKTGKAPVSAKETLEIYAFMEAADESKRQGGEWVTINSVMQKARNQVSKRLAQFRKASQNP